MNPCILFGRPLTRRDARLMSEETARQSLEIELLRLQKLKLEKEIAILNGKVNAYGE